MLQRFLGLTVLTLSTHAFLQQPDLTNSIYTAPELDLGGAEETVGDLIAEDSKEDSASPYRSKMTFRRRNINAGGSSSFSGSSNPFNRMAYKSGYGSNRGVGSMGQRNNNYYGGSSRRGGSQSYNPNYGMNTGGGSGYGGYGMVERSGDLGSDPFSSIERVRPLNVYTSGLLGNQKPMGYYGSTAALRGNKNYKSRPYDYKAIPSGANDLMSSFGSPPYPTPRFLGNGNGQGGSGYNMYNSRYESARFPEAGGGGYQNPYENSFPSSTYRGDMDQYGYNIATNQWSSHKTAKDVTSIDDSYAAAVAAKSKTVAAAAT